MSDNKELKFSVKMDNQGIQDLERKIRELNQLSAQAKSQADVAMRAQSAGINGVASGPGKQAFEAEDRQRRQELLKSAQQEIANNNKKLDAYKAHLAKEKEISQELAKQIDLRTKLEAKLKAEAAAGHSTADAQQEVNEQLKKEVELREKIAIQANNATKAHEEYIQNQETINTALKESGTATPGSTKSKFETAVTDMGGIKSVALGFAAAAVALLPKLIQQEGARAIVTQAAGGAGMQGTIGRELGSLGGDGFIREMAYSGEKLKAIQDAHRAQTANRISDGISPLTTIGASTLSGAALGAAASPFLGGALAIPGAIGGAALGVGKVGYDFMTNQRQRSMMLSPFSQSQSETYKALQAQDFAENFNKSLQGQREMNPLKDLAVDHLQKNYRSDLGAERMMGMSDDEYLGLAGFQDRANSAGFTGEMATGAAGSILGAGGSTQAAKYNANTVLQAQRGFDLTNAAGVMGKISGSAGNAAASDMIFKKLMEESVRAGLDKSDFREEQRKFAETASTILNNAGVTNADDAQKVIQGYSRFMGNDLTMKGMEGAKGAYDEFQSSSAQASGRGGALQFATLGKDKMFNGMDAGTLGGLMEIPDNQVSATHPRIIEAAQSKGIDPKDLAESLRKAKRTATNTELGMSTEALDAANKEMQSKGFDPGQLSYEQLGELSPETRKTYHQAMKASSYKSQYTDQQKNEAQLRGYFNGQQVDTSLNDNAELVNKKLGANGPGDRYGDKTTAAAGAAANAMLENFVKFKDTITPASDALDTFTKKIMLLAQAVSSASDADKQSMIKAVQQESYKAALEHQNASRPKR